MIEPLNMRNIWIGMALLLLLSHTTCTAIDVLSPPDLITLLADDPLQMHLSPIGFRPLSGRIDGKVVLA